MSTPDARFAGVSFWLETAGDDLTPRPPLRGDATADVGILGAGFTGLWTAYYLLRRDPSLRIVILDREIAGFGASGRNGGWCSASFALSPGTLSERVGREAARAMFCALFEAVDEVGAVLERESIAADFVKSGSLRVALGSHHLPALHELLDGYRALGLADRLEWLERDRLAGRIRIESAAAAVSSPDAAALHPGKLVRGLARVLEARGVVIHEQTEVTDYEPGRLITRDGNLDAETVVLAGESYLSGLRSLHRQLVPVYSLITLTEPLTEEQWERIGWHARECVASCRLSVDYLQRTADGRILFGGRGAPYRLGSRIRDAYDRHGPTHELLRGLAWAYGYAGHGVATANLAGRALADLVTGVRSGLTELPITGHHPRNWEPEPLRWLGVRWVQSGYRRLDARAERTGVSPSGSSVAERLGRH